MISCFLLQRNSFSVNLLQKYVTSFLSMLHNSPGISRMCDYSLFSKKSYNSYFYWRKMANFAPCRSKMREIIYKINY